MQIINKKSLETDLNKVLDKINADHQPILITQSDGKTAALISLDDFQNYQETVHLISSDKNELHLNKSNKKIQIKKTKRIKFYKKSKSQFFLSELFILFSQTLVFFLVSLFYSDFLRNKVNFEHFIDQNANVESLSILTLTLLAITSVIGAVTIIGKMTDIKLVENIVREILYGIPNTIYTFGSAISASMLAIGVFSYLNPSVEGISIRVSLELFFKLIGATFAYGASFSYALKRKTHILKATKKTTPN